MNTEYLGKKLKQFRMKSGKSQLCVETEADLSPGTLSRIENGITNPNKETILKIAKILNLNGLETASLFGIEIEAEILLNKFPHSLMQTYKS